MAIEYKIWDFPSIPIGPQLFHVPGMAAEGGLTAGGVRMLSPEPGGRAVLELQPAMQFGEWQKPFSSWIMSKINGQIFRVRLAATPQVITSASMRGPSQMLGSVPDPYSDQLPAKGDLYGRFTAIALEGSNIVKIDMKPFGSILSFGHVIGHGDHCYLVDDISYDANWIATITVTPPIRKPIAADDVVNFRPFFLGSISNGAEIRRAYDPANRGAIQLEKIVFAEVII